MTEMLVTTTAVVAVEAVEAVEAAVTIVSLGEQLRLDRVHLAVEPLQLGAAEAVPGIVSIEALQLVDLALEPLLLTRRHTAEVIDLAVELGDLGAELAGVGEGRGAGRGGDDSAGSQGEGAAIRNFFMAAILLRSYFGVCR